MPQRIRRVKLMSQGVEGGIGNKLRDKTRRILCLSATSSALRDKRTWTVVVDGKDEQCPTARAPVPLVAAAYTRQYLSYPANSKISPPLSPFCYSVTTNLIIRNNP